MIGHVQAGIPARKPKVGTGGMVWVAQNFPARVLISLGSFLVADRSGRITEVLRVCDPRLRVQKDKAMDCRLFALQTEELQDFLPCSGGGTNRRR